MKHVSSPKTFEVDGQSDYTKSWFKNAATMAFDEAGETVTLLANRFGPLVAGAVKVTKDAANTGWLFYQANKTRKHNSLFKFDCFGMDSLITLLLKCS